MSSTSSIRIPAQRFAVLAVTAGVAALATAPQTAAQSPGTTVTVNGRLRELVCRGKPGIGLRVLEDPAKGDPSGTYVTMQLTYTPATKAPGPDFNDLQPGECSWNPLGLTYVPKEAGRVYFRLRREAQPWSAVEPRAMDTTAKAGAFFPDPISLPRYLGDPNHYWVFYVDDATHSSGSSRAWRETGKPTFVTVSGPIGTTLASGTGILSKGPTEKNTTLDGVTEPYAKPRENASMDLKSANVGVRFHEVVRRPNEVWLRFAGRAGAKAEVRYGKQPPEYSPQSPGYPPLLTGIRDGKDVPVRVMGTQGFWTEYSTAPMKDLEQGTKYYFTIFIMDSNGTVLGRHAGEFTTMTQTVTVRFTRMKILNDSDKLSAGDLSFRFFVAPATEDYAGCTTCESAFYGRSWETGESHPLGDVVTLSPSPGRIRVWVKGWDHDGPTDRTMKFSGGGLGYFGKGGSDGFADWNFARQEFDVSVNPTANRIGFPFRLRSIDGSVFMFEVEGYVEVVRQ